MAKAIDAIYTYEFLKRLTTPFNETEAYKLGLIDEKGKLLKKASSREEKEAVTLFDRLIFNVKRLLGSVPGGNTKIASYAAALFLLRESEKPDYMMRTPTKEQFKVILQENTREILEELEEEGAPTNAAGTGANIAGLGENPPGRRQVKAFLRRKKRKKKNVA